MGTLAIAGSKMPIMVASSSIWTLLKQESRYLPEIFSISLSHVCAKLTKKFWPLLNQPASHGPFQPKLGMPLATVFVEIFQIEKKLGCF